MPLYCPSNTPFGEASGEELGETFSITLCDLEPSWSLAAGGWRATSWPLRRERTASSVSRSNPTTFKPTGQARWRSVVVSWLEAKGHLDTLNPSMGWRWRKVFRSGPINTTVTTKGVGWSIGVRGLRYGISPTGRRYVSVGVPGTGLYWTRYLDGRDPTKKLAENKY